MPSPRAIVHLDADAFFASVEQAADSRLRGKPIAVGGEKRGIIASASYEARKFGVYTPMPTARARKLCPKLIVLPGDYDRYEHFSRWMFSYAHDFTPDVEIGSIDEGYFDLSGTRKPPAEIALIIRRAIGQSLKITVSEGIGVNKLVSQIASKLHKPAAFFEVLPGQELSFLHPLANKWLPGIGPKAAVRLNAAGLARIGQVAGTPLELLHLLMGNCARTLRDQANGIDDRAVVTAREPQKSFGHQETFARDLTDEDYAEATLRRMADDLFAKVREEGRSVRTLTIKVRYNDMGEDSVSESLVEPTDLETDVYGRVHTMLRAAWKRRVSLRLVSLKLSNVYNGCFRSELPLEVSSQRQGARQRLALAVDELRRAQGRSVILRGHDFRLREKPQEIVRDERPLVIPQPRKSVSRRKSSAAYIPLRCHSHYSFMDSTLSPSAIVELAVKHGMKAVALTDTGNLHGAVEFVTSATKAGIKPILGVEISLERNPLLLYVESATGYHNLNRLLSRHAELAAAEEDESSAAKHQRTSYSRQELIGHTEGLLAISDDVRVAELFPGRFYRPVLRKDMPTGFNGVACPPVHYATPADRQKYDILQSIRTRTLLQHPHGDKKRGGRFHFRTPAEMAESCEDHPQWLTLAEEIAERCNFIFPFGTPQFPAFSPPDGSTASEYLHRLALQGLERRYGSRAAQFRPQVLEELAIISDVGYEHYFLLTWNFLQDCKQRGIEWITRGSAADSLVCYCLGISGVCPIRFDLYFRRFLNKDRMALHKLPDIDIDFAHDLKDDVVELIFQKYGRNHSAAVGGFFQSLQRLSDQ
jgi:nucleotidyltransferase/DNA polymerase involved in DNA repair